MQGSDDRYVRGCDWLLSFAMLVALTPAAASAAVSPLPSIFFADGFESGDLCAWSGGGGCPAPAAVSGTWVGTVDLGGPRAVAFELFQRADGSLLGYLLGATPYRTMVTGSYAAGTLTLELELSNRESSRSVMLSGSVSGNRMAATVSGDVPPQGATLWRVGETLDERRYTFVDGVDGNDVELAVVLDGAGRLVSGGFVGTGELWAPEGWITDFDESGDTLTLALDDESGCGGGSTATVTLDGTGVLYTGSSTYFDCAGSSSGPLLAGLSSRTSTPDAATVLGVLGEIADRFEAGTPFTTPHPAFASDYEHEGQTLAELFAEWNGEIATYGVMTEDLVGIRTVSTVDDPMIHPALRRALGVELDEVRTGDSTPLRDSRGNRYYQLQGNAFRVWEASGGLRISGNRQPDFDLPFYYSVLPGSPLLTVPTAGGGLSLSVGGYGAHVSPLTGHTEGNPKADLMGILPADDSEMTELVGDGDGIRDEGEVWGYWGGTSGELIRDRNVDYIARQDGEVYRILLEKASSPEYFDAVPHWSLRLMHPSGVEINFVHLGSFPPAFAARVLAATGCNPNDLPGCTGVSEGDDLLDGLPAIDVVAGEAIARPQIVATELPPSVEYPAGYYVGGGGLAEAPWAPMEFFVRAPLLRSLGSACVFHLLDPEREAEIGAAMHLDMLDPDSRRYWEHDAAREWGWRGEGALCNAETIEFDDFRSIDTRLGGWFERDEAGSTADERFAIFPIAKGTPVYDPALYDSASVSYLVARDRASGPFTWTMPDASTVMPFYPMAEVLERTDSTLLLKWREIGYTAGDLPVYQRAAYLLDSDGLKIEWGPFAATREAAVQPTLAPAEPCDDSVVLCYDHIRRPGL